MDKSLTLINFRKSAEKQEESSLHPLASLSKRHSRFFGTEDDHRLPYKRDVDRIVYSKAYARYIDKTQVAYLVDNDHITHRSLHVQLVSNFARGIAEILRLNLDLVEAISLGHDVGHPPFGHEGEEYLSALTQEYGLGPFAHPWQSCRLFTEIEPLNLGLAVYDGFLCHDGGMCGTKFIPNFNKNWETHFLDKQSKLKEPSRNIWPMSLEGCLVKLCDTISYLGRDIEDAISLGILTREELPKTILGNSNRDFLSIIASDVIENSYNQNYIAISDQCYDALSIIRKFNFEKIYMHPNLKVESKKIERSYRYLFETLLEDHKKNCEQSYLWKNYIHNKSENYIRKSGDVQIVVDFISGMTDNYFVRTLEKILVPRRIEMKSCIPY
jgi:dGTPase